MRKYSLGVIALAVLLVIALAWAAEAQPALTPADTVVVGQGEAVAGEIIVKFKPSVSPAAEAALVRAQGASVIYRSPYAGFLRLRLPPGLSVAQAVTAYRALPEVEYAEPNLVRRTLMTPNDPYFPYQWHMTTINIQPAWDIATGAGVVVAVIDTGIAYENYTEGIGRNRKTYYQAPDLAQTTFVPGYDFVNHDTHPNDDNSHGTHVAGTVAQSTNNSLGVAGVAFDAALMPVKVLNANGSGTDTQVADGIYFAANNGAHVINLSLGGPGSSTTLQNAVAYAYQAGVTIVAAAGNEGSGLNRPSYPAAYDDYVIAVAAVRYDETRAYYSNYGSYIDIAAPGGDLNVDQNGDGYGDGVLQNTFNPNTRSTGDFGYWFFQGTSMAAPHVAGVAALLISTGVTGPDAVRQALQNTARDKGAAGWDPYYGWGIVDAHAALTYVFAPVHDVAVASITAPASALQGEIEVVVTAANPGDFTETFDVTLTDTTDGVTIGAQSVTLDAGDSQALSFTWHAESASVGDHILLAEASAVEGETNLANNSQTAVVTILPPGQAMHVSNIAMALKKTGANTWAEATITIVDAGGNPVAGAAVSGHWSGATSDTDVGVTNGAGSVTLSSDRVKKPASGTAFTFTVDNVSLTGWTYDPAANVETSDSVSVP